MSPVLGVLDLPEPPGWDLLRRDLRAAYVRDLEAAGVRVTWPTGEDPRPDEPRGSQ